MQLVTGPAALDELPVLCRRLGLPGEVVLLTDDEPKSACGRDLNAWVS